MFLSNKTVRLVYDLNPTWGLVLALHPSIREYPILSLSPSALVPTLDSPRLGDGVVFSAPFVVMASIKPSCSGSASRAWALMSRAGSQGRNISALSLYQSQV